MKILLLLLIPFSLAAQKDSSYSVSGNFTKMKTGKIFLTVYRDYGIINDSQKIVNGKFFFKGHVKQPVQAYLYYKGADDNTSNSLLFYVESGKIMLSGAGDSLKDATISGSRVNADDKILKGMMKDMTAWEERNSVVFDEAYKNKNQLVMDSLDAVDMEVMRAKRKVVAAFVKKHPSSVRSAMAIEENYGYYSEASEVEPLYNALDVNVKSSPSGMNVKKMLRVYKTVATGMKAPNITQKDTSGNSLSLSSVHGKVIMIDFWASWCGPCRRENPNIVRAYQQYHGKGFEIFGVSYDTEKGVAKWKKAINDDHLNWYQVSDLKGWKNSTSDQYYIKAIPANILLDQNGKIIARNLFGKELQAKLKELLP